MQEIKNLGNFFFESYEDAYESYKVREELIRSVTIKSHVFQIQTSEIFNGERSMKCRIYEDENDKIHIIKYYVKLNKNGAIWNVIMTKEEDKI